MNAASCPSCGAGPIDRAGRCEACGAFNDPGPGVGSYYPGHVNPEREEPMQFYRIKISGAKVKDTTVYVSGADDALATVADWLIAGASSVTVKAVSQATYVKATRSD